MVFQDYLTKWPMVFLVTDQNEVIPLFGVPESLLSDRETNLLSHLMLDICKALGIKNLNTTAYHPQCDGMVERFNRTLKSMLRKHSAGMNFYPEFCGQIVHPTRQHRSRTSCLVMTHCLLWKLNSYPLLSVMVVVLKSTESNWLPHYSLLEIWQPMKSREPRNVIKLPSTRMLSNQIIELET